MLQGIAQSTEPEQQQWVRVALVSQDDKTTYASATTFVTSTAWEVHNATLSPLETDTNAKLSIAFQVPRLLVCTLAIHVSTRTPRNTRVHAALVLNA